MKLLLCIALGIPIVTDTWLMQSAKKKHLLELEAFTPKVPDQEREWGFSLADVWGKPHRQIFNGFTVYFTPALKDSYSSFEEMETVCKTVGCPRVIHKQAKLIKDKKDKDGNDIIFLGQDTDDPDCAALLKNGYTVYARDFLSTSILRGEINLDSDEFKIKLADSQSKGRKTKGRPKKN
jgi:hypothetical protein